MGNVFKKPVMKAAGPVYTDVSDELERTKITAAVGSSAPRHHHPCA